MEMPFRTGNIKIKSALTLAKNHCMHPYSPKFAISYLMKIRGQRRITSET
jgi:hypothetical protein